MGRTLHSGPLTEAQKALAAAFFPKAKKVAGQWQSRFPRIGEDDLQSATHMGLVKAARAYQPEMGLSFAALLCSCMRQELRDVVKAYLARRGHHERYWNHQRRNINNGWYEPYRKAEPGSPKATAAMRHILSLHHDDGLSQREIALLLGCNRRRISDLLSSPLAEIAAS